MYTVDALTDPHSASNVGQNHSSFRFLATCFGRFLAAVFLAAGLVILGTGFVARISSKCFLISSTSGSVESVTSW